MDPNHEGFSFENHACRSLFRNQDTPPNRLPSISLPLLFPRLKSPYPQTKTQVQGGALESHQQFLLLSITCDTSNPPSLRQKTRTNGCFLGGGGASIHLSFLSFLLSPEQN